MFFGLLVDGLPIWNVSLTPLLINSGMTCVLHDPSISALDSPFTALSSIKCDPNDKLSYLKDIKAQVASKAMGMSDP